MKTIVFFFLNILIGHRRDTINTPTTIVMVPRLVSIDCDSLNMRACCKYVRTISVALNMDANAGGNVYDALCSTFEATFLVGAVSGGSLMSRHDG